MKSEENNERTGDGRKQRAILAQESADGAGGCAEADEHHGKSEDEGEGGREEAGFRLLTLAELLDTDAGEHGDVAGNEGKHARGEK